MSKKTTTTITLAKGAKTQGLMSKLKEKYGAEGAVAKKSAPKMSAMDTLKAAAHIPEQPETSARPETAAEMLVRRYHEVQQLLQKTHEEV